jgi:hypothetical protein
MYFSTYLLDVSQTFAGTTLTISGWGTISSNGSQSSDLKVATVTGLSNTDCNKVYGGITSNMICAGTANFDTDTCQGDSGGEIVKRSFIHILNLMLYDQEGNGGWYN